MGKTVVSSQMIDRVTAKLGRTLYEVPVGFKWFVDGLLDGSLGFGGEESAGASFLRRDGTRLDDGQGRHRPGVARGGDHGAHGPRSRRDLPRAHARVRRACLRPRRGAGHPEQKELLAKLSPQQVKLTELAGETIQPSSPSAPGNGAPIGGLKVIAENGWFAARPSGTEDIYKIYAESFRGADHLRRILEEAQAIVDDALARRSRRNDERS